MYSIIIMLVLVAVSVCRLSFERLTVRENHFQQCRLNVKKGQARHESMT